MMETDQATAPKGRGRPRKQGEQAKDNVLHVYFSSADQLEAVKEAADLEGLSMAAWARTLLLREAKRVMARSGNR